MSAPSPAETPAAPEASAPRTAAPRIRRSSWRTVRLIVLLAVVVVVGVGAVFGSRLGKDPTLVDTPLIGTPVPDVTFPLLESEGSVSLRQLRGQILVVNFWASWCSQCRKEHPALMAANDAYRAMGVRFIGVDFQDQKSAAVAYLDELGRGEGFTYVSDPGSKGAVEFGVYGVPETFFVDRTGTIVAKITGAADAPLLGRVLDAIVAGRTPTSPPEGVVQPGPPQDGTG